MAATVELVMPKMGESIIEATILSWNKQVGDAVEADETILEIATDKVDSEVPSPADGVIKEILFAEGDAVEVGKVIAIISTGGEEIPVETPPTVTNIPATNGASNGIVREPVLEETVAVADDGNRFYSPLVRNIAKTEGISQTELATVAGTGANGRVTKKDILAYVETRGNTPVVKTVTAPKATPAKPSAPVQQPKFKQFTPPPVDKSGNVEIVEMDRMRRLIADHMVMSKHVSPHVTSFVEADVTNIVNWRKKNKVAFQERYGEKITYTPIFIEAVVKALKDFPMVNISVADNQIVVKKDLNIGMATALPSGNLIVPVIKNADYKSLAGLTKDVNDLASRARANKLKPDEIQGGTFTVTNVGTFGNVMGTPIINQPQVAILAVGAIRKKPAVVETEYGDVIAIRQMMFLSLSYDHRVVDGFLGGSFLRRIGDYLEAWDVNREL